MYNWLVGKYYYFLNLKKKKFIDGLVKNGLVMGKNVQIPGSFFFDPSHCFLISIGDNCTFAPNVSLIAHDASTFMHLGYTKIGKINIGNDCFFGDSVIVLPNVNIGDGSIIGSGSVVTKDVPLGMIVAGNPARIICSVDEYLNKIKNISKDKKIFGLEYSIDTLTTDRRGEILRSVEDSIGFIV